ncbi:hypothetical protein LCGC14_1443510, partial [marine sediment metagenome]
MHVSHQGLPVKAHGIYYRKSRVMIRVIIKGGPGSGHRGHRGRPGKRGGSLPGSNVISSDSIDSKYQMAGDTVDGRKVIKRDEVPNITSISASFYEYTVLNGIREVPVSEFDSNMHDMFYAADDIRRVKKLADAITHSNEITPLIVAVDFDGPYILEGAHRLAALDHIGARSFPAMIVIDNDESIITKGGVVVIEVIKVDLE